MRHGTVRWFNRQRGFGSVAGDDGREYLVHERAVEGGFPLDAGMRVQFNVAPGEHGDIAVDVKILLQPTRAR
ncbi:MAG: cold shock domain-containing protein [Armatimonadetes bacterium]|nr:cold shock domain-containing protein [Armatimonadota bacterium]